jgi:hypothetical protein
MHFPKFSRKNSILGICIVFCIFLLPGGFVYAGFVSDVITALVQGLLFLVEKSFSLLAWLAAYIMVFAADLLQLAINISVIELSKYLNAATIVDPIYTLVRNFANTFFIFILMYLGIKIILNAGEYKKLIVTLIITAIMINFSYLVSTLIIDSSNIIATGFYNKIDLGASGSLGVYIKEGLKLQEMTDDGSDLQEQILSQATSSLNKVDADDMAANGEGFFTKENREAMNESLAKVIFALLAIIFYFIAAYIFLDAAFLFIGRYIAFIFLIIFSPLAFASYTIPKLKSKIWDKWFEYIINQSFVAPVFLLFLYIIAKILSSTVNLHDTLTAGQTNPVVANILFFVVAIGLLQVALTTSRDLAGEMGAMASKYGKMAAGAAVGAGATAGAYAGKKTIGRAGAALKNNGRFNQLATSNNLGARMVGKSLTNTGRYLSKSSFDLRGTPGLGKAAGMAGISLGSAKTEGFEGYKKRVTERKTEIENERLDILKSESGAQRGLEKKQALLEKEGGALGAAEAVQLKSLQDRNAKEAYSKAIDDMEKRASNISTATAGSFVNYRTPYEREALKKAAGGRKKKDEREDRNEAEEDAKDEFVKDVKKLSEILKGYNASNKDAVKSELQNAPMKVVVEAVSKNKQLFNDKDFVSGIDPHLASSLMSNNNFKNSASQKHLETLRGIRDKDRTPSAPAEKVTDTYGKEYSKNSFDFLTPNS